MGWFLRLLLFIVAARLTLSGMRRLLAPTAVSPRNRGERGGPESTLMMQDPQCGRFVAEQEAVRAPFQGQVLSFCSPECRDLYTARR